MCVTAGFGVEEFQIDGGLNRFTRVSSQAPGMLEIRYEALVDVAAGFVDVADLSPDDTAGLIPDAIPFLFPSRYCQSDMLRQQANMMFGGLVGGHAIATAVCDWIFSNIAYVSGSSGETCSALDTFELRQGVCRDFAHLGIALCRALNVPARYVTVYAHQLNPQDFHACFEAYIGGCWYVFDPTRLAPLNGLVKIATGRDAADVAVGTIFGDPVLTKSIVSCEPVGSGFTPVTREALVANSQLIALL
jgi:transglutaminase-like putative cysteine protease